MPVLFFELASYPCSSLTSYPPSPTPFAASYRQKVFPYPGDAPGTVNLLACQSVGACSATPPTPYGVNLPALLRASWMVDVFIRSELIVYRYQRRREMNAAEQLAMYADGWTKGDAAALLRATADEYILDDPNMPA